MADPYDVAAAMTAAMGDGNPRRWRSMTDDERHAEALAMTGWDYTKRPRVYDPNMRRMEPEGLEPDGPIGPVGRYAGPAAMAAAYMDRESRNVEQANLQDALVNLLLWTPARKVVGAANWAGAKMGTIPKPTLQEIGDLLPKGEHWPMPERRR